MTGIRIPSCRYMRRKIMNYGKSEWRPLLDYVEMLHGKSQFRPRGVLPYPWEDIGPDIAMVRPSGIGMQYTLYWTFWKTIWTRPGTRLTT